MNDVECAHVATPDEWQHAFEDAEVITDWSKGCPHHTVLYGRCQSCGFDYHTQKVER